MPSNYYLMSMALVLNQLQSKVRHSCEGRNPENSVQRQLDARSRLHRDSLFAVMAKKHPECSINSINSINSTNLINPVNQ
jgi:hypothetical protein